MLWSCRKILYSLFLQATRGNFIILYFSLLVVFFYPKKHQTCYVLLIGKIFEPFTQLPFSALFPALQYPFWDEAGRNSRLCYKYDLAMDLYKGSMVLAVLLSIHFIILSSMEFAFFIATAHWMDNDIKKSKVFFLVRYHQFGFQ